MLDSDYLPIEFYAHHSKTLLPRNLDLFNTIFETSTLPASMQEVLIILIPKPGKDSGQLESYRPILLLQVAITILEKILAICLNKIILSLRRDGPNDPLFGSCQSFHTLQKFGAEKRTTLKSMGSEQ